MSSSIDINQRMELETLDNLDKEQNSFLESTLGKVHKLRRQLKKEELLIVYQMF